MSTSRATRNTLQWDIGVVTFSGYDADGFLTVQHDAYGEQDSGVAAYETHSLGGLIHRPLDPGTDSAGGPIASQAAQVMFAMEGGKGHGFVLEDPRTVAVLPTIKPGETLLHGDVGNFVRCHADGSITLFTTDQGGNPAGQSVFLRVQPTGLQFVAPWGKLTFDATGFHALTSSGARIDLGGVFGAPAPLDKLNSYASMQAATVALEGSVVSMGALGTSNPLANATAVLAALGALQTAVSAIQAAITAPGVSATGGPTSLPGAAASAGPVGASATAIAQAALTVPTAATST